MTTPGHAFVGDEAGSCTRRSVVAGLEQPECGLPADAHRGFTGQVVRVVAVDPGPIPGVAMLTNDGGALSSSVFQCDPDSVLWLVRQIITGGPIAARRIIAVERFVVGMRAANSAHANAGAVTRDMIGALTEMGRSLARVSVVRRSASEVMTWSNDKRLKAAGLYDVTKAMPHARAASRHGLFAAVRDGNVPDPLSTKAGAR